MKPFKNLAFLGLLLLILYLSGFYFSHTKPVSIREEIVDPDMLLTNTKRYFQHDARDRSIYHLELAIEEIEKIEQEIEPADRMKIDTALMRLREVHDHISSPDFDIKELNDASMRALNALTFAELKVTEHFVDSHQLDKARVALSYGQLHVKNALVFSEGLKRDYEVDIYTEMDSLIESETFSDKEILHQLESMIDDLDKLGNEE